MSILKNLKNKSGPRPAWERFFPSLFLLFLAFATADVLILAFRDRMLPTQVPPARPKPPPITTGLEIGAFNTIISRNIFSSDGIIPPILHGEKGGGGQQDAPPTLSQLPLNLIGTLVHSNPERSIAAIEVKSKNQVISYTPKKEIEGLATVEKVERMKVIIRNLNNNRLEYLEIKTDSKVSFGTTAKVTPGGGGIVSKVGENEFRISRTTLDAQLTNLPEILRQAKALPATDASGNIYGFRITAIEPGSVYGELGILNGDVITGVQGNPVTSAQQAMEMYQNLRTAGDIEIQVERDGRRQTLKYQVK